MSFADMTRDDRAAYFNFHGGLLLNEWAQFVAAAERWSAVCKRAAAFEDPSMTAEKYLANLIDSANNPLAEEVVDYVGP